MKCACQRSLLDGEGMSNSYSFRTYKYTNNIQVGMSEVTTIDAKKLPHKTRSRFVDGVNGLRTHILEGGFDSFCY